MGAGRKILRAGLLMEKKVNFGDILAEWLQNNKITDKDANAEKTYVPVENKRRLLRANPDDILDIHGLTGEKAWITLDHFFTNARDRGCKKLRIIHGKGNKSQGKTVLGSVVRKYIEKCPFAGESGYEKSANGGTGATWVLLKN